MLVISTTNPLGLADHARVQALIGTTPSLVIDVDPTRTSTQPCDLRIAGTEPEAELVKRVAELLTEKIALPE
jgi:hypothetical protein